jgi:hypothetical protein
MSRSRKVWSSLAVASAIAALSLSIGTSTSGAFFSDTKSGTITGSVGSIKVTTSGGGGADALDLNYTNLLPGTPQTVVANYTNTGLNTEDVWVVFPNADALHALNNLGTYGELHLASSGTQIFDSANLNDGYACGTPGNPGVATLCPLAKEYKLVSGLVPNGTGNLAIKFNYAGKLSGQSPAGGGVFNAYPLGAPTSSGLPYQIVATQEGQTP